MSEIASKADMYARLNAGLFGNTVPAFMGLASWYGREPKWESPLWGVRSMKSGDKRARLDIPTAEVAGYCRSAFGSDPFNVSPMVDQWLVWRGEVYDSPAGLVTIGTFGRKDLKWRQAMAAAQERCGVAARALLREVLNGNSFDDLMELVDHYPGHVVELTALERCYGTCPGRNAVVWEVRCTTGEYERSSGWAI